MNAITKESIAEFNAATPVALTLPERAAVALGTSAHEIKLRELVRSSADIVAVIDAPGREQAHRIGMNLKGARVAIEKVGKTAREDATAFSKAIIAEEKRLIAISEPEESRILILRDGFDQAEQARKDAAIAAERARTEAIQARIEVIRQVPFGLRGKTVAEIEAEFNILRCMATGDDFDEFKERASQEVRNSVELLAAMLQEREAADAAALAVEQARIAEAARIAAEVAQLAADRAELAEQQRVAKVETDRIAAEQAATAKRLTDQQAAQELAAKLLADKAAAELKAERDAQELAMRLEREKRAAEQAESARVAADLKTHLDEQQAAITAQREALEREQAEAAAQQEAAIKLLADHAEALTINAAGYYYHATSKRDDGQPIMCNPNGSRSVFCDVDEGGDDDGAAADLARRTTTAAALLADASSPISESVSAYIDAGLSSADLTDDDIIKFGKEFFLDLPALVARLDEFCVRARDVMGVVA